ncbi:MAG: 3D domain-containing protein [Sporolactobacillus sp.]
MNIIKGLTAVTSLTVFMGMMTPTAFVHAKTNSTNDNHVEKSEDPDYISNSAGFSIIRPANQSASKDSNMIFGNNLLQQGDNGPSVAKLQDVLQKLGYYTGNVDGIFGASTLAAVNAFQLDSKLNNTGIVGAATKTVLYDIYRNTPEFKKYQEQLADIKVQEKKKALKEKKEAAERARIAAEQAKKEAAAKVAAKAAKAAAAKAAQEKQKKANQPVASNLSYHPQSDSTAPSSNGQSITVLATSYSLNGRTATGTDFGSNPNAKVIAVDPSVIPLGSRVEIPGYGVYVASDTGGAIKGKRIDIHLPTKDAALNFGVKTLTVQILH